MVLGTSALEERGTGGAVVVDRIGGRKRGSQDEPSGGGATRRGNDGAYPTAEQWVEVFRHAEMPLWLADITGVKQAIREVAATGVDDLRAWLELHPEFISLAISRVRLLELSDMAVQMMGARDREEFHRSIDRLIVPEALPSFKAMLLAVASGEPIRDGESVYRTLDGRTIHTWNQVSFLKSQEGADLLLLAMTDLSRLKSAQDRLSASEERYRTLVETARDMILCHDLEGRLTFVNQAGLDLTGWTRGQMIGMSADDLVPDSLHEEMAQRAAKRTSGDTGVFLYETRYRTAGGAEIPVEVSSTLIQHPIGDHRMSQVLVVARDISGRKRVESETRRLEARLRNAQKLESLGVLATGIAHDFNNYLVAIMGGAELLREELPAGTDLDRHVDLILGAAGSIADLCRQMQLYAAEGPVDSTSGDLSEMVASISRLLNVSVAGKAQLNFELEEGLPPVQADESQIGQVVVSLVANAVESLGDQGGVVVIRTGSAHCAETELARWIGSPYLAPGTYVFCEVRDSGCGMDEETASRLFEPFYTTKFVGRGVGLFAAQGIIQKHGGGFRVETRPDQGSTITFLLPAKMPTAAASRPGRRSAPGKALDLGGKTILVVDDQKEVREVAESLLRRFGCRVLVAASGFDALRVFGQRHAEVDLVLLDLTMDGMDGIAAGRRLRTILPGVPIVFTSGFTEEVVRRKGAMLAPFEVLVKPYKKSELREVLERMLAD